MMYDTLYNQSILSSIAATRKGSLCEGDRGSAFNSSTRFQSLSLISNAVILPMFVICPLHSEACMDPFEKNQYLRSTTSNASA